MKKLLIPAVLLLSACASTNVKVNGFEIPNQAQEKSRISPLVGVGAVVGIVALGLILTKSDKSTGESRPDTTYQDCLAAGLPEPHCRSLITG